MNVEFFIKENFCRCNLEYIGISTHPCIGLILSLPEYIEIEEKRREYRYTYYRPEFVTAEFRLEKESEKGGKIYNLNVLDCSRHGLGLIVTKEDFHLLQKLNRGDKIKNITFHAEWAMIKVEGSVRHITKIDEGKYKGCYLLGIESPHIIEKCRPDRI